MLVDGRRIPAFGPPRTVVDGDAKSLCIAAATSWRVVATLDDGKTADSRYGFISTRAAAKTPPSRFGSWGPCSAHRRSYSP